MPNSKLGSLAAQEIRDGMRGLTGAQAATEALRLAQLYDCSIDRVYSLSRGVRTARRARADKGSRAVSIFEHDTLRHAAELVTGSNLTPEIALEMAELSAGVEVAVSLATFRRQLREHGLNRARRRSTSRAYRPFEAAAPMDIYQFDLSGVKDRWVDLRTRRLYQLSVLDDSRNHPYEHPTRVKLWKASLIDDHSRRRFIRFFAPVTGKPNATHCIEFLLEAFREMGIPRLLYTDRDQIIRGERMTRAGQILDRLFEDDGGFRMEQHRAHNPQATGKVERTHQTVELYEPLINLYETSVGVAGATFDRLNDFARELCDKLNWTKHRATNEIPMLRWQRVSTAQRIPPPAVLDSVFTADEFVVKVNPDVTVAFEGRRYQLPRRDEFPFGEYAAAGRKVKVIRMKGADTFFVAEENGTVFEIEMVEARADTAGEFKSLPDTKRARAMKDLDASAKERKHRHKENGTRDLVPGMDGPFRRRGARAGLLPKQRVEADAAQLAEVAPAAAVFVEGRPVNRWDAIALLQREGHFDNPVSSADKAWLNLLFGDREEVLDAELLDAVASHRTRPIAKRA
jgi:hypothetical protein